jgi:hypothetical protein
MARFMDVKNRTWICARKVRTMRSAPSIFKRWTAPKLRCLTRPRHQGVFIPVVPLFSVVRPGRRELRLRLRLRCAVMGAIAPFGHELVELGAVLGKAQPPQELLELALLFFEPAQRIGAIFIESAIAA